MFIRNDASDSPANRRWRLYEKCAGGLLGLMLASKMTYDGVVLSDSLSATNTISGLQTTIWSDDRKADLADGQLKGFRANIPLLTFTAISFVLLHKLTCGAKSELNKHLWFYVATGLGYGWYMHGPGVLVLLAWAGVNYLAAKQFTTRKFYVASVWIVNLGFLIHSAFQDGYRFAWIWEGLKWMVRGR